MLHVLKRHPVPVSAFFRHSLVLTYAFPRQLLDPLLPAGLVLDTYGEHGFLAIALVETQQLRPSFLPAALGRSFFLSGYRIFARFSSASSQRGLRILRSDTDSRWMVCAGNLLTHYHYKPCLADLHDRPSELHWTIRTPHQDADLEVVARIGGEAAALPEGSPFPNEKEARRFAGPLPYTFDYEQETHSIIRIHGLRQQWNPKPVEVEVRRNTFFDQEPFNRTVPIFANAFHVQDVSYQWMRGVRVPLGSSL
jgi:hypothetical protein